MAAIKTILIVEDDRFIGEMYVRSLKKAGYDVDWMVGGNDGLIAARNKEYDLMLLDLMLPEKRGNEILDALRGKEDLIPNTHVIVTTNFEQDEESRLAMEKGADEYLIKAEITPRKMLDIIKKVEQSPPRNEKSIKAPATATPGAPAPASPATPASPAKPAQPPTTPPAAQ